jgi:threonine dehydratase
MIDVTPPTLDAIRATRAQLGARVIETPVVRFQTDPVPRLLGEATEVHMKLELLQHTGSFKPRGALAVMLDLPEEARRRGVVAVSAGNHAIAVGYAAAALSTSAKVVMTKNANPARLAACRYYGATIELADDVQRAFERARQIEAEEGRTLVHPFEGPRTALGTATLGLEFMTQVPDLDAVIVPIGGGGLAAGVASAVKLIAPRCQVFGVEPDGADTMHRSFRSGRPESIDKVRTIADSLGAPHAAPYSFAICRKFVDELVLLDDDALRHAMVLLFGAMKLVVEPAGAAATAALVGPLRERLRGKRVGVIVCGSNIDAASFAGHLAALPEAYRL